MQERQYPYIGRILADFLFPPRCPGCGELIRFENRAEYHKGAPKYSSFIHKKCRARVRFIEEAYCRRCGTPVKPGISFCERCDGGNRAFDEGRSAMIYENEMRKAMADVKYHSNREYCNFFAFAAADRLGEWIRSKNIDMIVPVPVHPKKEKERGYNQAEVLALRLSEYTGIPVRSDILIRKVNTRAQKELTPDERRLNLAGAFGIREQATGSRVLLLDDIFTTGATMEVCAMTLKAEGGAYAVFALSILAAERLKHRPR